MNLASGQTFAVSAPGRLGVVPRGDKASVQIGKVLKQMQLDVAQVQACVDEVYPRFMQAINYAHFEREACFVYALQSMFAVTVLTHAALEEEAVERLKGVECKSQAQSVQAKVNVLDELVTAELLRIGFIDNGDDDAGKCFKRMMFGDAWKAVVEEGYCRVGAAIRASIDRVLHLHLSQASFEETAIYGVTN